MCLWSSTETFCDVDKEIGFAFAIQLPYEDTTNLPFHAKSFRAEAEATINQTHGWTAFRPIFCDGEVITKSLYITYAIKLPEKDIEPDEEPFRVEFVGLVEIGNTGSVLGVLTILHFLKAVAKWGLAVYEPNFRKNILARHLEKEAVVVEKAGND
ncbi:MAG: hypothetical protein Q9170_008320 [Blastenia crenularia]